MAGRRLRGTREILDPADARPFALVAEGDERDTDLAVAAARRAFDEGPWPRTPVAERAALLRRVAGLLVRDREELGLLESRDAGKTAEEGRVDIDCVADAFRYFADLVAAEAPGRVVDAGSPDVHSVVVHEPVGVCALITPWNYPLLQASWKIAPALARGNTFVVKPSEITPLTTVALIGLLTEAGLPARRRQHRHRPRPTVGARMAEHPGVDLVSFTGGLVSGVKVAQAAAPTVKKVALELGGKNPNVVFADACATEEGFDTAVDQALNAAFIHSGQVCSAGARLIVEESVRDRFVAELARRAERIRLGRGTEEGVECGPLVSAQQREKVEAYVESALKEGAVLRCGGKRPEPAPELPASGYFYEPTVLDRCHREMRVVREEVFGPVLTVETFRTEDEAVALANDTEYGLARRRVDGRPRPRPPGRRAAAPRHRVDQRLPPLSPPGRVGRLRQERHGPRTRPGRARGVPRDQARVPEPGTGTGAVVPRLTPRFGGAVTSHVAWRPRRRGG